MNTKPIGKFQMAAKGQSAKRVFCRLIFAAREGNVHGGLPRPRGHPNGGGYVFKGRLVVCRLATSGVPEHARRLQFPSREARTCLFRAAQTANVTGPFDSPSSSSFDGARNAQAAPIS